MLKNEKPKSRTGVLAGIAVAVMALTVPLFTAAASVPNSVTGAITVCVKNQGGAVRVVDAQAGAQCATDERSLSWPGVGGAATQYFQAGTTNLSHDKGQLTTVILGPVLPPGIWSATANLTVVNNTGVADMFRCVLHTGGGAQLGGTGDGVGGADANGISVTGLVTLPRAERINLLCAHDNNLPAGALFAVHGGVVAEQMTSRF